MGARDKPEKEVGVRGQEAHQATLAAGSSSRREILHQARLGFRLLLSLLLTGVALLGIGLFYFKSPATFPGELEAMLLQDPDRAVVDSWVGVLLGALAIAHHLGPPVVMLAILGAGLRLLRDPGPPRENFLLSALRIITSAAAPSSGDRELPELPEAGEDTGPQPGAAASPPSQATTPSTGKGAKRS
jgi:hypothetical protein